MNTKYKLESGIQLLARLRRKPDIAKFYPTLFGDGPNPCDVIEIFSDENATSLLLDVITDALLPATLGGVETGVVILNTDGNMDFDILIKTLRRKLIKQLTNTSNKLQDDADKQINEYLQNAVSNLYVLEIFDATQLCTTIQSLECVLAENQNISLVVVDTLTAFYWSEQGFKITKMDIYLRSLLRMIQNVTKDYKTTIIYTRPEYFSSSKDSIENLEGYSEQPALEHVNYRVQIIPSEDSCYKVNIKTYSKSSTTSFQVNEDELSWL